MPVFQSLGAPCRWQPLPMAAGPFAGLQGGAVAGLLTAEIEALAAARQWGMAVSAAVWFLRPTPMGPLRTKVTALREGGRVNVVDNTLWPEGEEEACATVRVTLIRPRAVEAPGLAIDPPHPIDPTLYPQRQRAAPHGGPWFMDAMEAREGPNATWFRLTTEVVEGAGPLSLVLGPADWAHGIGRPLHNVLADPNPNLTVHLYRPPHGAWIGVQSKAWWDPAAGVGVGSGALLDTEGVIGSVSMGVALVPFPKPKA